MNYDKLLYILKDEAVFESNLLLSGDINPKEISRQLSRWTKTGKIHQLRRGLYLLAQPYRKKDPHPFYVANRIVRSSYVSLQSALSYYGMIPEFFSVVTSVTTGRPYSKETVLGRFEYRHIKMAFFNSYKMMNIGLDQEVFIGSPEKSLFDLLYLVSGSQTMAYLRELRLHFPESFNMTEFLNLADRSKSIKMVQIGHMIQELYKQEQTEFETL